MISLFMNCKSCLQLQRPSLAPICVAEPHSGNPRVPVGTLERVLCFVFDSVRYLSHNGEVIAEMRLKVLMMVETRVQNARKRLELTSSLLVGASSTKLVGLTLVTRRPRVAQIYIAIFIDSVHLKFLNLDPACTPTHAYSIITISDRGTTGNINLCAMHQVSKKHCRGDRGS